PVFFFSTFPHPPRPTLFPYTTLFRSRAREFPARRPTTAARCKASRRTVSPRWWCASRRPALTLSRLVDGQRAAAIRPSVERRDGDRKSTRLNSSHVSISYAVFCLKKK